MIYEVNDDVMNIPFLRKIANKAKIDRERITVSKTYFCPEDFMPWTYILLDNEPTIRFSSELIYDLNIFDSTGNWSSNYIDRICEAFNQYLIDGIKIDVESIDLNEYIKNMSIKGK